MTQDQNAKAVVETTAGTMTFSFLADKAPKKQRQQWMTSNAGLLVVLRSLDEEEATLVLGSTHLAWNPKLEHVRLRQAVSFLRAARKLAD